jgi:6-phosphogluconolactonase (cycloisomerase 2 family)
MLIVNKAFLYVPMGDTTVAGYSINRTTGALTLIAGSPFVVSGGTGTADDLATDPLGRFLFVGSEGAGEIWVFQINSTTGVLTATAGSPFTAGLTISDEMTVDASGQFLYAGQITPSAGVAGFSINQSTGALTTITGSPFQLGVAQLHASPKAELLLGVAEVADGTTSAIDPHIYVFGINSTTGVPTAVTGSPFLTATGNAPFDFVISPSGLYVYAVEANVATLKDALIEGFALNPGTGVLSSLGTFNGVPTAESCQFDQSGVYLFCANTLTGSTLTVNAANPTTGALAHVADLTVTSAFPFAATD